MKRQDPLQNIFAFRAIDFRDRFPEPVPTFRAALEKLQSDDAYMPEMGEIIAYTPDGRSIPIPTEFFIRQMKQFQAPDDAEAWVRERAARVAENPHHRILGALIANADDPIEKQVEDAINHTYPCMVDKSENPSVCAAVYQWLRDAVCKLSDVEQTVTRPTRKFVARLNRISGVLLTSLSGNMFFREYKEDGNFTDFDIFHSDLSIIIDDDEAAIYQVNGDYVIDHAPETLGLDIQTKSEEQNQ